MLGGLARRATIFKETRKLIPNSIFLAGFYELSSFYKIENQKNFPPLAKIYEKLGYDLKVLTQKEALTFKNLHINLNGWIFPGANPEIRQINVLDNVVSIVILPENVRSLKDKGIKEKLNKVKKGSHLVIALSPYGYEKERELLTKYNYNNIFDILLGSGKGPAFTCRQIKQRCLWIRPISRGQAIYFIKIKHFSSKPQLIPGKTIEIIRRYITEDIPPDPEIKSILKQF